MRGRTICQIVVACCLALCHAKPQPDPEPEPDVNVNVNIDVNQPKGQKDNDINVDVNLNIVSKVFRINSIPPYEENLLLTIISSCSYSTGPFGTIFDCDKCITNDSPADDTTSTTQNPDVSYITTLTIQNPDVPYITTSINQNSDVPYITTSTTQNPDVPYIKNLTERPRIYLQNNFSLTTPNGGNGCLCGELNYHNRIVGGTQVDKHLKYPWHVGLKSPSFHSKYYCAGSIINNLFILSAAHCFYFSWGKFEIPNDLIIGIGDHNQVLTSDDIDGITIYAHVDTVVKHPNYDYVSQDYDFSLIKLKEPLSFDTSNGLRPVCLPENSQNTYEGYTGTVMGWGLTSFSNGHQPHILREVQVPILGPSCENKYGSETTASMLCAEYPGGGKDACSGDSGGSLSVAEGTTYVQVGVVSWGYDCAKANNPGVYSRVTTVLDWIKDVCRDADWCERSNT